MGAAFIAIGPLRPLLTAARGMEMMVTMGLCLMNALGTARFGYRLVT